jgi:hypothetical protein
VGRLDGLCERKHTKMEVYVYGDENTVPSLLTNLWIFFSLSFLVGDASNNVVFLAWLAVELATREDSTYSSSAQGTIHAVSI